MLLLKMLEKSAIKKKNSPQRGHQSNTDQHKEEEHQ
jgi:hypothetical protein